MSKDVFIGIGGTGSKVAESLIHLCASGLGPDELTFGLVDQDGANGNTARTCEALGRYHEVKRRLLTPDGDHFLSRADSDLFRTTFNIIAVKPKQNGDVDAKKCIWIPHVDDKVTLASVFQFERLDDDLQDLLGVLYRNDPTGTKDAELYMALDEGYRGRPSIGASAMLSASKDGSAFWAEIDQAIKQTVAGGTLRIFLAGSVFGGTGAAGLPAIAKRIRHAAKENKIAPKNLQIAAVLMMPYFQYPPPGAGQSHNVARAEEHMQQTQVALQYYHTMLKGKRGHERVFDELYVSGWNPFTQFDYHADGKNDQANPALLPELFAASAALRFFTETSEPDPSELKVYASSREEANAMAWEDLPTIDVADQDSRRLTMALSQYVRFLNSYHFNYRPNVEKLARKMLGKPAWYKNYFADVDFDKNAPVAAFNALDAWTADALRWSSSIGHWAEKTGCTFRLWDAGVMAHVPQKANEPIEIKPIDKWKAADFNRLVSLSTGVGEKSATAEVVLQRMSGATYADKASGFSGSRGIGQFVAGLYRANAPRSE